MTFTDLPVRRNRKSVAQNFYSLLVLQKVMAVELDQGDGGNSVFAAEISIKKGPNFDSAVL